MLIFNFNTSVKSLTQYFGNDLSISVKSNPVQYIKFFRQIIFLGISEWTGIPRLCSSKSK